MASRYLHDDSQPQITPVASANAVASGDLVAVAAGNAVSAADWPWTTDLATTQAAFVAAFLGASAQTKLTNVARIPGNSAANLIRIDTAGAYEFDAASATFTVGQLVGPAKQTGNALEPQKVVGVAGATLAIGSVVEAGTALTKVKVRLHSTLSPK